MKGLQEKLYNAVWDTGTRAKPAYITWPLVTLRLFLAVLRDLHEGQMSLRATSLVYTTLLSLAPLLAISFSVLKGFGVHNQIEPFLREFLRPLGAEGAGIALRIVEFVENIKVDVLGVVGFLLLLYSVVAMMHKIEAAFNDIWRVSASRSFITRVRDYLSVLFIGPLFIFLSVGMTAVLRHADIVEKWTGVHIIGSSFESAGKIIPGLLFMLAFAALYAFMPNTRVQAVPALVAGMVTGILWKTLGWLFGIFMTGSASYAAIYSAFAALILFMIWLYVGWLVVLTGASIAYYIQNPSNQRMSRHIKNLSLRVKEKLALMICHDIGSGFYAQEKAATLLELAKKMKISAVAVEDVVDDLVKSGILATTGKKDVQYIPGCPFDTTSVYEMLKALRAADEDGSLNLHHLKSSAIADKVAEKSDGAAEKALGKISLKNLSQGDMA